MRRQMGFTLLEMMIAITILAALMMFSNQSIQTGMKAKVKIQDELQDMSAVRDALRVMEKDINLAMHYRDIELEYRKAMQSSSTGGTAAGTPPPTAAPAPAPAPAPSTPTNQQTQQQVQQALQQWMAVDPKRVDPTTDFIGATDEMHFVTMNAPRISEDIPQADFIKVGYYLSDCKKPGDTGHTTKCLLRSADPLVEGDITKNGPATVLLENVTEFKLRYINTYKQDWVSDWNTKTGDASAKGNFPESVEISLKIEKGEGSKKKKISMQIIAPIRFPNNPPTQNGQPGTQNGTAGTNTGTPGR